IRTSIQQAQPQNPGNAINVRNNGAVPPQLRQQRPLGNVNWAPGMTRTATPNNGEQVRVPIQQAQNHGPFTHAQQKIPGNTNFGNNGSLPPKLGQQRIAVTAPNMSAQYRRAPVQRVQGQFSIQSTTQPAPESTNQPQANGYIPPSPAPVDSASYSFWDELDKLDATIPSFD
ncbi:hypothetical protein RUND412_011029, partial [Rhizina undulata]